MTITAHTDDTLKSYMLATLQGTASTLGWSSTSASGYTQALYDTQRAYPDATDMQRLEALARREIWRQAMAEAVRLMDLSEGEQRASLSQQFTHIKAIFDQAKADVDNLPVSSVVGGSTRQSSVHQNVAVW